MCNKRIRQQYNWLLIAILLLIVCFVALGTTMVPAAMVHGVAHPEVPPDTNPENGMQLFGTKGCVVCHTINKVGGSYGILPLDASAMPTGMTAMDMAAAMWNHAQPMIALQRRRLGVQIRLTGKELGDIIAFLHELEVQKRFTEDMIPSDIKALVETARKGSGRASGQEMPTVLWRSLAEAFYALKTAQIAQDSTKEILQEALVLAPEHWKTQIATILKDAQVGNFSRVREQLELLIK